MLDGSRRISYGAVIVAIGGQAYEPKEYMYAADDQINAEIDGILESFFKSLV